MSTQESDKNHPACPKCKSTDLAFKGLHNKMEGAEPHVKAISATYSWKCQKCKHEFEITIPN
jgi:hypothetical protein